MSSYYVIGLVNKIEKKEEFIFNCKKIFDENKKNISNFCFEYPMDEKLEKWEKKDLPSENFFFEISTCMEHNCSSIYFDLMINNITIKNILVTIECYLNDSIGLYINIPDIVCKIYCIDQVEKNIEEIMDKYIKYGFDYSFCDYDAKITTISKDISNCKDYSILFINNSELVKVYANWKIDGLSLRKN